MFNLSFFGMFSKEAVVFCFSDSIVQKTTQPLDGGYNITSDSQRLSKLFSKQPFGCCKDILKKYCEHRVLHCHHDANICFSPNFRYHILLLCKLEELLQKLDPMCFTKHYEDCLYTIFEFWFTAKNVVKSSQVFHVLQKAVCFNQTTKEWTECPASWKWDSWGKSTESIYWAASKDKINATQWISFSERIEQCKKKNWN